MKARIKVFEEMPPDTMCCTESIEAMKFYCGTEVNLNPKLRLVKSTCCYCGNTSEGLGFYYAIPFYSLRQDMIDIDEGENATN